MKKTLIKSEDFQNPRFKNEDESSINVVNTLLPQILADIGRSMPAYPTQFDFEKFGTILEKRTKYCAKYLYFLQYFESL